jgi:hypothetical protein
VLFDSKSTGYKLRLHVWWPGRGVHTENVHNHRWSFSSVLLSGEFEMEFFVPSETGRPMSVYTYTPIDGSGTYTMLNQGTRRFVQGFHGNFGKGAVYSLEHTVLHRITTGRRSMTATLVLQSPASKDSTTVLTDERLYTSARQISSPLPGHMLAERLIQFAAHLDGPGGAAPRPDAITMQT